jgi:UDP-N-acetylmuramoyl-tripeptide--D-alanyl-D-alanine ligase
MNEISIREICEVLKLAPPTEGPANRVVRSVSTDTRTLRPDALFVAVTGDRFDGHLFLEQAAAGGAVAALVDRLEHRPVKCPPELHLIQTANAREAMGKLARHVRGKFRGKVIAVAGSNGKTGTKFLIDSILRRNLRGSFSPRSHNNDIGVPLAIFAAPPGDDYLVLEIGTNHPGEIATLARIAEPDIGVITNCSIEHLEGLGSVEGVRLENAALIEGIRPGGLLIVNGDDPLLLQAVSRHMHCVTFGLAAGNTVWASNIRTEGHCTRFTLQPAGAEVYIPLLGQHSAVNSLAAIAVGRAMHQPDFALVQNLRTASAPDMRLQLQISGGVRVLNDAYNANPSSMRAALQTLMSLPAKGRRIAVVGDMRELGAESESLHQEIGRLIAGQFSPDFLVCVGALGAVIGNAAARAGFPTSRIENFETAAIATVIAYRVDDGDLILLKGSRAIGLEAVAKAILNRREPVPAARAS